MNDHPYIVLLDQLKSVFVAGISSAAVDLLFSCATKKILVTVISILHLVGNRGIFRVIFLLRLFGIVFYADSLSEYFATVYAALILQSIWNYIEGKDTDDEFVARAGVEELNLWGFLATNMAVRILPVIWAFELCGAMTLISMTFAFWIMPQYTILLFLRLLALSWQHVYWGKWSLFSVRGIFLAVYEPLLLHYNMRERAFLRDYQGEEPRLLLYVYQSIQLPRTIRLLRLEWRIQFSKLSCSLLDFQLDEAPSYEALSHTWGAEPPSIPLTVDGATILVTRNVQEFLWYSRSFYHPKYFWIDAVCINQKDNTEKSSQLPLMKDIYSKASRTVVWLTGPETLKPVDDIRFSLSTLAGSFPGLNTMDVFSKHFGTERENAPFEALHDFFSHPWLERVWVIQEVATSKIVHVQYGGMCVDWSCVELAATAIQSDRAIYARMSSLAVLYNIILKNVQMGVDESVSDGEIMAENHLLKNVSLMARVRASVLENEPGALGNLLYNTMAAFKSTDPKDKIFALLGISDRSHADCIPNYSSTTEKLFLNVARLVLEENDWYMMLCSTGRGYQPTKGTCQDLLPSWVPDWNGPTYRSPGYVRSRAPPRDWYPPPGDIISHVGPYSHTQAPKMRTKEWTKEVKSMLESGQPELFMTTIREEGRQWYTKSRELARRFSASGRLGQDIADEEFWSACMSESDDRTPEYLHLSRQALEQFFFSTPEEYMQPIAEEMRETGAFDIGRFSRLLRGNFARATTGKMFGIAAEGRMVLIPPFTRVGDILAYIKGVPLPFVLRQMGNGNHELVGTCYVHGVEDEYSGEDWTDITLE
ncbi:heterokaryon incompatibility protein-domain-containing protein [Hyaloscypha finlandica]|nr:heterokaryon incompatibility protein-domain-containing protein [Hyaloscypha finlandica]